MDFNKHSAHSKIRASVREKLPEDLYYKLRLKQGRIEESMPFNLYPQEYYSLAPLVEQLTKDRSNITTTERQILNILSNSHAKKIDITFVIDRYDSDGETIYAISPLLDDSQIFVFLNPEFKYSESLRFVLTMLEQIETILNPTINLPYVK